MSKRFLITIFIFLFLILGINAHAQVRSTDIVLSISPENPNSNQNVTAKLSSYSTDMSKAYISWSLNGKKESGGIGKVSFVFNTKELEDIELTTNIETIDGQNLIKTIRITPTNVDMLWEAYDSYVPPFYKGKALVPREGGFKVVAIPNTINNKLNVNNLSYTWEQDGQGQVAKSGWGKNSFVFYNNFLDNTNVVNVKISDITNDINTEGEIILPTYNPKILFYEKDPIFGININKAINTEKFEIKKEGVGIVAIPYFISPKNLNSPDLKFEWSINNNIISIKEPKNEVGLKPENGQGGEATLRLILSNTKALFTGITKEIVLTF